MVTKQNEDLRVANAELKALNEMQEKLNAGIGFRV
jgi:hypothetical protein